jgi:DNA polymerase elongation subunit (family B)
MDKYEFYPLDFDYTRDGTIQIIGKTINNERIIVIDNSMKQFFYAFPKGPADKLSQELSNIRIKKDDGIIKFFKTEVVKKKFYDEEVEVVKCYAEDFKDYDTLKDKVKELGLERKEIDIKHIKRYLTEKNISPLVLSEVNGELIEDNDEGIVIKGEVKQKGSEFLKNPRILAFDIEVYGDFSGYQKHKQDPIIMISFRGEDFKKVITWKKFDAKDYVEFVNDESELIWKFIEVIKKYKPDYITGFFSDGFDFPYLRLRADELGIKLNLGIDDSLLSIRKVRGSFSSARIKGIPHIDVYRFISRVMGGGLRIDTFNLNTVANEILGDKKIEFDLDDISQVWDSGDLSKLVEYNLKDSDLAYLLCKKIIPNMNEISKFVGMPIYNVCRATYGGLVENYLIKKGKEFNEIIPNRPKYNDIVERYNQTYEGGFVMEPIPGFYSDIVFLDFRSLYASIIISKNISPSTLSKKGNKTPEIDVNGIKNYYYFSSKKSFIPTIIKDLILERVKIKEQLKGKKDASLEGRSYALKTIGNSIYGYLGFSGSRYHCKECAASITAWARYYIKDVIKKAVEEGFEVIYSDTDSVGIALNKKTKEDALDFLKSINDDLPEFMELELEKFYKYGLFVGKKGSGTGAKKKYALIDDEGEVKIIGFETVRGDWSIIAKETQKKVIELILKENSFEKALKYVQKVIQDIKNNKIDINKMVMKTQLKMNLEDYKQIGPHVSVARRMKELGVNIGEGSVITYVIAEGSGLIRDRAKLLKEAKNYDKDYYINNQIIPSVEKIFEIRKIHKEDLLSNDQSKLGEF